MIGIKKSPLKSHKPLFNSQKYFCHFLIIFFFNEELKTWHCLLFEATIPTVAEMHASRKKSSLFVHSTHNTYHSHTHTRLRCFVLLGAFTRLLYWCMIAEYSEYFCLKRFWSNKKTSFLTFWLCSFSFFFFLSISLRLLTYFINAISRDENREMWNVKFFGGRKKLFFKWVYGGFWEMFWRLKNFDEFSV